MAEVMVSAVSLSLLGYRWLSFPCPHTVFPL